MAEPIALVRPIVNESVIEILRGALVRAQAGEIIDFAVVTIAPDGATRTQITSGLTGSRLRALGALTLLQLDIANA